MRVRFNWPKQQAYATSLAINETAKRARWSGMRELRRGLTIRTAWMNPGRRFGVNIRFARRRAALPIASVYSRAPWLENVEQDGGGIKRSTSGRRLAIPSSFWKKKSELMPRRKKPKAILPNQNQVTRGLARLTKGRNLANARAASARSKAGVAALRGTRGRTAAKNHLARAHRWDKRAALMEYRRKRAEKGFVGVKRKAFGAAGIGQPFKIDGRYGPGIVARNRATKKLVTLFSFKRSARVPEHTNAREVMMKRAMQIFPAQYAKAMTHALRTAKP